MSHVTWVTVFAVGSPYAWDVVESARRSGVEPVCLDNHGGADARLPGLATEPDPTRPFVLGLSSGVHRVAGAQAAAAAGFGSPTTLIDPSAVLASTSIPAHGAYANAGVVVASHSEVGCHVNLNRSASIGHDNVIGFGASIGPGAVTTGGVQVGTGAFVGAGATVLPGVAIGRRAIVGAGAVVTKDVPAGAVVAGNPARVVRLEEIDPTHGSEDRCPHC